MDNLAREFVVIGCGPGAPEYVTANARKAVSKTQLLAGAPRLLDLFPESRAHRHPFRGHVEPWLDRLETIPMRPAAILVSGDPGISCLAQCVLGRFGAARCHIEPGISSVQLACARLGISWHDATIVDVHRQAQLPNVVEQRPNSPWLFLMGAEPGEPMLADLVESSRRAAHLIEDLSLPTELIRRTTPTELRSMSRHPRRIVVLLDEGVRE